MTYLSRRVREINEEEYSREHPVQVGIDWAFPDDLVYLNRRVLMEESVLSPVNYLGRGA